MFYAELNREVRLVNIGTQLGIKWGVFFFLMGRVVYISMAQGLTIHFFLKQNFPYKKSVVLLNPKTNG